MTTTATHAVLHDRGARADYHFGTRDHGWRGFRVVRWHGVEELSRPFRFEITLTRDADLGPIAMRATAGAGASFVIAGEHRHRTLHGIVERIEELDRTAKLILYRVVLGPHFVLAKHRVRCRTWRRMSVQDVVSSVLANRLDGQGGALETLAETLLPFDLPDLSSFSNPHASHRWVLREADSDRLLDPDYRSHLVQYNESDFHFVSRILEREGLTYFFEHGHGRSVMTITDRPGNASLIERRDTWTQRNASQGGHAHHEIVRTFREGVEVRPGAVRHRDYRRVTPLVQPEDGIVSNVATALGSLAGEQFMFPSPGGRVARDLCGLFSRLRMELHECERFLASGSSSIRMLEPGARCTVRDGDGFRDDADVVIVRVEHYGAELSPEGTNLEHEPFGFAQKTHQAPFYENRFHALRAEHVFRPALTTPAPRINGVHPAIVTTEEAPGREINTNQYGDVRLRFPWDQRAAEPGLPSSKWVPVSTQNAGTGFGMVTTPRVGQAVYAMFEGGDPDRPVVVGGYYSDQMPPPFNPGAAPTMSMFRTNSSPGGGGANQMSFDDSAGGEMFSTVAQKDQSVQVGNNFDQRVVCDHTSTTGNDSKHTIFGNSSSKIGKDCSNDIAGDASLEIGGDVNLTVGGDLVVSVGGEMSAMAAGIDLSSWKDLSLYATESIEMRGQGDRADTTAGTHVVNAKAFYMFAESIEFHVGGSKIALSASGITISSGLPVEINGKPVKLNC